MRIIYCLVLFCCVLQVSLPLVKHLMLIYLFAQVSGHLQPSQTIKLPSSISWLVTLQFLALLNFYFYFLFFTILFQILYFQVSITCAFRFHL